MDVYEVIEAPPEINPAITIVGVDNDTFAVILPYLALHELCWLWATGDKKLRFKIQQDSTAGRYHCLNLIPSEEPSRVVRQKVWACIGRMMPRLRMLEYNSKSIESFTTYAQAPVRMEELTCLPNTLTHLEVDWLIYKVEEENEYDEAKSLAAAVKLGTSMPFVNTLTYLQLKFNTLGTLHNAYLATIGVFVNLNTLVVLDQSASQPQMFDAECNMLPKSLTKLVSHMIFDNKLASSLPPELLYLECCSCNALLPPTLTHLRSRRFPKFKELHSQLPRGLLYLDVNVAGAADYDLKMSLAKLPSTLTSVSISNNVYSYNMNIEQATTLPSSVTYLMVPVNVTTSNNWQSDSGVTIAASNPGTSSTIWLSDTNARPVYGSSMVNNPSSSSMDVDSSPPPLPPVTLANLPSSLTRVTLSMSWYDCFSNMSIPQSLTNLVHLKVLEIMWQQGVDAHLPPTEISPAWIGSLPQQLTKLSIRGEILLIASITFSKFPRSLLVLKLATIVDLKEEKNLLDLPPELEFFGFRDVRKKRPLSNKFANFLPKRLVVVSVPQQVFIKTVKKRELKPACAKGHCPRMCTVGMANGSQFGISEWNSNSGVKIRPRKDRAACVAEALQCKHTHLVLPMPETNRLFILADYNFVSLAM